MRRTWQLQEAKNKLSAVVEEAIHNGPQTISRHGKDAVVVLSIRDFKRLAVRKSGLVEFFRSSPLCGLDLERSKDPGRQVEL